MFRSALIRAQWNASVPGRLEACAVVAPHGVQVLIVQIDGGKVVAEHEVAALRNDGRRGCMAHLDRFECAAAMGRVTVAGSTVYVGPAPLT